MCQIVESFLLITYTAGDLQIDIAYIFYRIFPLDHLYR